LSAAADYIFSIKPNKNAVQHIVPTGQKRIWGFFYYQHIVRRGGQKKNEVLKFRPFKIDSPPCRCVCLDINTYKVQKKTLQENLKI